MSTANRRERPWCYVKDMFCNHRCYQSFLAFNSIKEMEKQKEFEGCFSSGSLQVAQVCRKRLFLSKKAATSEGGMITLSRCDLSHIQSCICRWTLDFSHWRMITALLKPMMRDLGSECSATSGPCCSAPSIQLELTLVLASPGRCTDLYWL